jgi:hypothetical protein
MSTGTTSAQIPAGTPTRSGGCAPVAWPGLVLGETRSSGVAEALGGHKLGALAVQFVAPSEDREQPIALAVVVCAVWQVRDDQPSGPPG